MTAPPVNVNPLVDALRSSLAAVGVPFGDSNRPSDVTIGKPYVVAFFDGGRVWDRSLLSRDQVSLSVVFFTYAETPGSARVGRSKLIAAIESLAGQTFGGWVCHLPVHVETLPMEREDKVNPPLYWSTDDFMFRMTPA